MNQAPGNLIDQTLNQMLKVPPGLEGAAPGKPQVQPAPVATQPQGSAPAPAPTPPPVDPGNVSQASTDAASALLGNIELPNFDDTPAPPPAPGEEPPPGEQPDGQEGLPDDDSDLPEEPSAVNFKKLRESRKEERKRLRELQEERDRIANALERYERGEVMPEVIAAKDQRIRELETYEKTVDLKLSREYQENFVIPAQTLQGELTKIAEDYGLPPHMLHQAVNITNRRELNGFLSKHLDDAGALEVRRVINELQDLGAKAIEAEKEPEETMTRLRQQYVEREQKEREKRVQTFESVAKNAWGSALDKTKKEGAYRELVLSDTDPEWNKTVVEPIQQRAAMQFGALVKQLEKNGLKVLPDDLAKGLARMVLLSIGGAMTIDQKNRAERESNEISSNARRLSPYLRPSIGGNNGSGHSSKAPAQTPRNPQEAADLAVSRLNRR